MYYNVNCCVSDYLVSINNITTATRSGSSHRQNNAYFFRYPGKFKESAHHLTYVDEKLTTSFSPYEGYQLILALRDKQGWPDISLLFHAGRCDLYSACVSSAEECQKLKSTLEERATQIKDMDTESQFREENLRRQVSDLQTKNKAQAKDLQTLRQRNSDLEVTNSKLQGEIDLVAGAIDTNDEKFEKLISQFTEEIEEAFPEEDDD